MQRTLHRRRCNGAWASARSMRFHYQEFTKLPAAERPTPDPYALGDQNTGSLWEEFLVPDTAEVVTWFDDPYWYFPAMTRNRYDSGTATSEGTFPSDML